MPRSQLESVMKAELGATWRERVSEFEWEPSAAASIGQVRRGSKEESVDKHSSHTLPHMEYRYSVPIYNMHAFVHYSGASCDNLGRPSGCNENSVSEMFLQRPLEGP